MKSPLLEPTSSIKPTASCCSAIFNISTTIIGSGLMSIPSTLNILGVFPAIILIFLMALLSNTSSHFMLTYTVYGSSTTYSDLMAQSFGHLGSTLLQLCVMLNNFGAFIVYSIIIGDVVSGNGSEGGSTGILVEWSGPQWWNTREVALLATTLLILLPLALLKQIDSLKYTSAMSTFLAVVFVLTSSGMAIYALFNGKIDAPKFLPDFGKQSFSELFTAFPVIVLAFAFHYNFHPIYAELKIASDMKTAIRISLLFCSVIYSMVGLFGYLLFGDSTMSDMLANFDQGSTSSNFGPLLNDMVRISYVFHLVLVFPLLNFSLRLNIDEMFFSKKKPLASDNVRFVTVTVIIMALAYLAAIGIPNIWVLFQFIGSTTSVCIMLIFPGAIVLRNIHGISKTKDKLQAGSMITVAIVANTIAIASHINRFFDSP